MASFAPGASSSRRMAAFTRETLDTNATPALYAAFGLFSSGDYDLDYPLFRLLSLCTFAAAVLLLARAFGWWPEAALLFLAAVQLWAVPFISDAAPVNVNQIQVGGLALVILLLLQRRDLAAGALLGLLAVFKPNLAPAALLLCVARVLRGETAGAARLAVAGLGAAALAVAGSSLYLRDARSWLYWWELIRHWPPPPVSTGNFSIPQWLIDHAVSDFGATPVLVSAGALGAVWAGRRTQNDVAVLGLGCAATLLGSPLSWLHYYLLLVPFVMFLLRPGIGPRRQALAVVAALALAGPPLGSNLHLAFALMTAGALLLGVLCAAELVARSSAGREAVTG